MLFRYAMLILFLKRFRRSLVDFRSCLDLLFHYMVASEVVYDRSYDQPFR
jgi:hypothetical protein